jgi:hypothetical protein
MDMLTFLELIYCDAMKVLKFTLGGTGPPEIEFLEETLGMGDDYSLGSIALELFTESIGFNDSMHTITELLFTESLGLGDILPEFVEIVETMSLGDALYESGVANIFESLGLGDDISNTMDIYVGVDEIIGLGDGGFGYLEINYNLRWRTRTKKLTYGFGTAPHGDQTSYGDGDVIDELKEFKVKVIRLSDDTLLRTATITITNKQFPDGSAQYIYTAAMNVSDNTTFEPNLRFEVYQVDIDDVWSPAKYIDITATSKGGDLE